MTEIRDVRSERGWGIDNHMLLVPRLEYILRQYWQHKVTLGALQLASSTRLCFDAMVIRLKPPQNLPYTNWVEKEVKIKGEMILSTSFAWTQSATPALEMRTDARVYYVEEK